MILKKEEQEKQKIDQLKYTKLENVFGKDIQDYMNILDNNLD